MKLLFEKSRGTNKGVDRYYAIPAEEDIYIHEFQSDDYKEGKRQYSVHKFINEISYTLSRQGNVMGIITIFAIGTEDLKELDEQVAQIKHADKLNRRSGTNEELFQEIREKLDEYYNSHM